MDKIQNWLEISARVKQKNIPVVILIDQEDCPYCRRVMRYMNEHDIDIPVKDPLDDPTVRRELVQLGGKSQFPALLVNGEVLYESLDIIDWMAENLVDRAVLRTA